MERRLKIGRKRAAANCRRAVTILAASIAPIAWANSDYWNDGTGNWSIGGNWLSDTVPAAGDTVNLTQSDATTRVVTFDAAATSGTGFASLTIDATGSGSMSLYQATGALTVTYSELIGLSGKGTFNQAGGSNTLEGGALYLGVYSNGTNPTSVGVYSMSGNAVLNTAGGYQYVGYYGNGTFNQAGGTNTTADLYVGGNSNGTNPASIGVYSMSNGAVLSAIDEFVGYSGNGTFNQTGGTNTTEFLYLGYNSNGTNPAGVGVYSMSNGAVLNGGTEEFIGYSGNGTFNQTGGANTTLSLYLGFNSNGTNPASVGVYSMSNSAVLNVSGGTEEIGVSGSGTFNQAGGSNTTELLYVADSPSAVGVYSMSNGAVLNATDTEFVGASGNGTFNQTGGSNTAATLYLGYTSNGTNPASVGTYSMSNGAVLSVTGTEYVGESGNGTFNQAGGTNTTAYLYLGVVSNGTYSMSNGAVLNVTGTEYVGFYGNGTFNQTGGTNTTATLYLGYGSNGTNPASVGTYNLSNSASLIIENNISVGAAGVGTLNQYGGTFSMYGVGTNGLRVGDSVGGTGVVNLSGGLMNSAGSEYIGYNGSGFFNQTGGSNTTASLYIAYSNSATGTYSLSAGVLTSTSTVNNGHFNQFGGTATLGVVTGPGTLTLSGGLTTVTSFHQGNVSISSGGYLAVATNASAVTNFATLSITGSGQLDLANNNLLTTTSASTVRQYLINGYNSGAWNGTGGISSSNAAADAALGTNGVGKALGFVSGTSVAGANLGLATNQTLVKFTIYGDSNLDGVVNILDFGAFSANFGHTGVGWEEGDYNYDGVVNILDFGKLSANFGHTATATVAMGGASVNTLTGAKASSSASTVKPAATPAGSGVSVVVNTTTGDVHLSFNNIQSRGYEIDSPSGEMETFDQFDTPPGPAMLLSDGNIPANDNRGNKYWIVLSSDGDPTRLAEGLNTGYHFSTLPTINQTFDLGDIFVGPSGTNVPDLSVLYVDGSGDGFQQVVQYVGVPEPTTLGLLGIAAMGLIRRGRRERHGVAVNSTRQSVS